MSRLIKNFKPNIELQNFQSIPQDDPTTSISTTTSSLKNGSENSTKLQVEDPYPDYEDEGFYDDEEDSNYNTDPEIFKSIEDQIRQLPYTHWGKIKPLCKICGVQFIKPPGFQWIVPSIMVTALVVGFYYSNHIFDCVKYETVPILSKIFHLILLYCVVKTAFVDPGFIRRQRDPELIRKYPGRWYSKACMITMKEKKEKNIQYCYDCELCAPDYDHHCVVIGMCVAKENFYSFYGMIVSFLIFSFTTYYSLYLTLEAKDCGIVRKESGTAIAKIVMMILSGNVAKLITDPLKVLGGMPNGSGSG